MAKVVEVELVAKTDGAVAGVNKVDQAVKKTASTTKKASKELSGMQQIGGAVLGKLDQMTGGLASKLVAVGKAAKLSGKAMKTALISSGIGLAVVALGLIVEYWDDISEALGFVNNDLEKQVALNERNLELTGDQLGNLDLRIKLAKKQGKNVDDLIAKRKILVGIQKQQILDSIANLKLQKQELEVEANKLTFMERAAQLFVKTKDQKAKVTEEEQKEIDAKDKEITDLENRLLNIEIAELPDAVKDKDVKADPEVEARAKSIEEITKLEDDFLQSQLDKQTQEENAVYDKYFAQIEAAKQYGLDTTVLEEARQKELQVISDTYTQEAEDKEKERAAKILESENKISISKKRFAAEQIKDEVLRLEKLREIDLLEAEQEAARLQVIVDNADAETDAKINAEIALNEFLETARQKNLDNEKKVSDASIEIAEEEEKAKKTALDGYAGAVSSLSNTIGQETAAGKGLAVASSLISTYAAITATLENAAKTPAGGIPGYAIAQSVATGIAGLAAVKKIMSVQVPGGSGGGSSQSASMPTAPTPPAFNIVGASGETQLADAIGSQTQRPARAYVVSNDVTTAQEMDRNIIEGASIG